MVYYYKINRVRARAQRQRSLSRKTQFLQSFRNSRLIDIFRVNCFNLVYTSIIKIWKRDTRFKKVLKERRQVFDIINESRQFREKLLCNNRHRKKASFATSCPVLESCDNRLIFLSMRLKICLVNFFTLESCRTKFSRHATTIIGFSRESCVDTRQHKKSR